jgi:hypothetical protein
LLACDALEGGDDVGSRVHGAASACLVASGLFLCGLGGALAIAEPSSSPDVPGGTHSNEVRGEGPSADPSGVSIDGKDDTGATGDTDDGTTGTGGNPDNGNCGNDGSNGNAQHCGGGSSTSPTKTTTQPSSSTKTTSPTTPSATTTRETTSTETTSSDTTSSETSETTTSTTTTPPGLPAPGGGGGGGVEVPSGRPELPSQMQLPPELMPPAVEPPVIDVVPGVGAAAVELPIPLITLPVIVAPASGLGGGLPGSPALPVAPRGVTAEPPAGREPLPANAGSNVGVPASSYRIGYSEYLRNAGLSQVAALAVPGVAGMLVLTGAGGLVGYRQAKAGHAVHTSGTARFVN